MILSILLSLLVEKIARDGCQGHKYPYYF